MRSSRGPTSPMLSSRRTPSRATSNTARSGARREAERIRSRASRAATTREPSSSPTSAVRPTNGSSWSMRHHWQPTSQRQTSSGYHASAVRNGSSSPRPSWKTTPPVTSSSSCWGVVSQSTIDIPARGSKPSCRSSHAERRHRHVVRDDRVPAEARRPAAELVREAGASIRDRTSSTSSSPTKSWSRGPHPWSVERSVSKPTTSEPQPSNAAECRTSRTSRLDDLDVERLGQLTSWDEGHAPGSRERRRDAEQTRKRQEREAVRSAQGQGHVEGARGEDRQLAGRLEPRRQGVALGLVAFLVESGRHDRAEEGRRPQGRQGHRPQAS